MSTSDLGTSTPAFLGRSKLRCSPISTLRRFARPAVWPVARDTEFLVRPQLSNISLKSTFEFVGEELRIDDKDALQFLNRGLNVEGELRTPLVQCGKRHHNANCKRR